jgi:hypothetical protein
LAGLLVSAPWWGLVVNRYGVSILGNILSSHDNLSLLTFFKNPFEVFGYIGTSYLQVGKNPLIGGGAILGLGILLARREFRLPAWLAVVILMNPSEDRFIFLVACVLAAEAIAAFAESIRSNPAIFNGQANPPRVFLALIVALTWLLGWYGLRWQTPAVSWEMIQSGVWFQEHTSAASTFLLIADEAEEAEWFPYFLRRTPSIGSWGAEWMGSYNKQLSLVSQAQLCSNQGSLGCVQDLISKLVTPPTYLITHQDQLALNLELNASPGWELHYENDIYQVHQRTGPP